MTRLLLVEDEEHIANGLKFNLEMEGYLVLHARTGAQACQWLFADHQAFDLVILDIMLPDMSGFDLCFALRRSSNYTPVLMLTAKNFQQDKIQGLQLGADDYVTKPFNLEELLLRIQALLRRKQWGTERKASPDRLIFGEAIIDFKGFQATVAGQPIKMTQLEFKLLKYFAEHQGQVLSRRELLKNVWDIEDDGSLRTVDNFVLRLRKFFEPDPSHPRFFQSIRGVGYKFVR